MKTLKLVSALIILFQVSIVSAAELSVEQVQKFISISGLAATIDTMPDQFQQQINLQALTQNDKVSVEKVRQAMESALASTNGYQIAESYLLARPDSQNLINTIQFLESSLGQQVVAAEASANEPEFAVAMQSYTIEISKNPPSEQRTQLVDQLNEAMNSEDTIIDMLKTMMLVSADFFEGLNSEMSEDIREAMEAEWEKMEPMLRAQMSQYVILASYYVYKDLNDQQLSQYIDFLESADGQVYSEASIEIFQRYVNSLIKAMLANIIEEAKS